MQLCDDGLAAGDAGGPLLSILHIAGCTPCTTVHLCRRDTYTALTNTKPRQLNGRVRTQSAKQAVDHSTNHSIDQFHN